MDYLFTNKTNKRIKHYFILDIHTKNRNNNENNIIIQSALNHKMIDS